MSARQDVRSAWRALGRQPGLTLVVVLTLGLGIGATTAIVSVVHAVVFRPLPYSDPDRLVRYYTRFPSMKLEKFALSPPEFRELSHETHAAIAFGAWSEGSVNVSGGPQPVRANAIVASGQLLPLLGVAPERGRFFTDEATLPGAPKVAILGHGLWQSALGGDPEIVGKSLRIDGVPTEIVGVMPATFEFPERGIELWLPITLDPADTGSRSSHYLQAIGRLAPGVSVAQARAELDSFMASSVETHKKHPLHPKNHPMIVGALHEDVVADSRPKMMLLLGAVGFVLLIACANIASVLLARAESRHKEVALRATLGAGRWLLVRQSLAESLVLAVLGGIAGLLLGDLALRLILTMDPVSVPRVQEIGIDGWVLGATTLVALVTGLVFGLVPALQGSRPDLVEALKVSGQRTTAGRDSLRLRRTLVVAEVALAVVLVTGAGLLIKSFARLLDVSSGFDPKGLVTLQLSLPGATYEKPEDVVGFTTRLQERVRTLPGVKDASLMLGLPPNRPIDANDLEFEGLAKSKDGPIWNVDYWQIVGDHCFETLRIPLREGRYFAEGDGPDAPLVAVVNESMAKKFWGDSSPVGRRLRVIPGDKGSWLTVVGVVADVKQRGLDAPVGSELYMPASQAPTASGAPLRDYFLVARTSGPEPLALVASIRSAIAELDASLPVANIRTMDDVFRSSVARPRFVMTLLAAFALIAVTLAAVGIYGVLAHTVALRTNEIGVRMALGAKRRQILADVVRQGLTLAGIGLAVGLGLALALGRVLDSLIFGISATDPMTLALVVAVVALVALCACLVPAGRAVRVDPIVALRYE
jgi:putative ABC transport system permease protein